MLTNSANATGLHLHIYYILYRRSYLQWVYRVHDNKRTMLGLVTVIRNNEIMKRESTRYTGWAKKRGHSVLPKYCSDLHDFFAEIKVV